MANTLVPEFAVRDWRKSKTFYCDILGFAVLYDRQDEGFLYLCLGEAELMIDQLGAGRSFDHGHAPVDYPFGRGVNLQISVDDISPLLRSAAEAGISLYLEPEERWYRRGTEEISVRQFVVADPDGYLLRFSEELGVRKLA